MRRPLTLATLFATAVQRRISSYLRMEGLLRSGLAAVIIIAAAIQAAPALAERRIALVIGNGAYAGVSRLSNPVNDASLVTSSLAQARFDKIVTKYNLSRAELIDTLRAFEDDATQADIAVVYFSGHGLEINGENYLVPTDAHLRTDKDVEDET